MNQYFTNNENLRSELRVLKYSFGEYNFMFNSDLGVFSKDKLDEGSRTLIETYFKLGRKNVKVLDVGAGSGLIGITLAKVMDCEVTMVDVNHRAMHLCEMNIKANGVKAKVFESDGYAKVNDKYDVIITNPPIRAGKEVYLRIINEAFQYLAKEGELWFVMRNNQGVKTIYKDLKTRYNTEILCKNKGFYVILAKTG